MRPSLRKLTSKGKLEAALDCTSAGEWRAFQCRFFRPLVGASAFSDIYEFSNSGASPPPLPSPLHNLTKQDGAGRAAIARAWGAFPVVNRGFSALPASVYEDPIEDDQSDDATSSTNRRGADSKADIDTIAARVKFQTGKIAAKKDRKALRVPGVVYSLKDGHLGGNKVSITVAEKDVNRLLRRYGHSFVLSRPFTLEITSEVDGVETVTREAVLPRSIDYAPARDDVTNITFIRLIPGERIKVDVPLVYTGADGSPGIRRGGYLNTIKRTVKFSCPSDNIPTHIEVDLSKLDSGEKILLGDLAVHPDCVLVKQDESWPVCKIMGQKGSN